MQMTREVKMLMRTRVVIGLMQMTREVKGLMRMRMEIKRLMQMFTLYFNLRLVFVMILVILNSNLEYKQAGLIK